MSSQVTSPLVLVDKLQSELLRILGPEHRTHRYVLAVSGGADSMLLLELFARILPASCLTVAHFNHSLRPQENSEEEKLIQTICQQKGLRLEMGKGHGLKKDEASLRHERRQFLESVRLKREADYIVTAHHLDDQWETVTLRGLRGAGVTGLSGMKEKSGVWLKPLLRFSQNEIREEGKALGIAHCEDSSNLSLDYLRNRVRHKLKPVLSELAQEYGGWQAFLTRFSETLADYQQLANTQQTREKELFELFCKKTSLWIHFERAAFLSLSAADQLLVLRSVWGQLGCTMPARATVERVAQDILRGAKGVQAEQGVEIVNSLGRIFIQSRPWAENRLKTLVSEGQVEYPQLGLILDVPSGFDADVIWRTWEPGDLYRGKTLKTWFEQRRVPRPERQILPVAASRKHRELTWIYSEQDRLITVRQNSFIFSFECA